MTYQFKNIKLLAGGAQCYQVQSDNLFDAVFHGYSEQSVLEYLISLKTGKKRLWPVLGQTDIINGASSHSGRRSFITNLAGKGIGVRVLASLAGHKSIMVTQQYIDVNDDMKRNAVELV